ncbi:type VI secretion system-associated protein TagF [Roseomonas sp. HF4]|uniref:type VI secretion system-associated protein TagF n=1 Tax=Roseomonas sp. HF4 TaxID=2562313 RepID=UPI0010C049F6|nr:type VI secretion system-associated protein TagF [Roseomonas sp. HF4]
MPDPRPLTGLFGKVPAHGDFVRRGLPTSFVAPWDAWLQAGIARARDAKGAAWAEVWDTAPAWRFALPAGACGPDAVAGVMLPSEDQVGRRFPITLAALLAPGAAPPSPTWFDVVEAAAMAGRAGRADADALAAAIPLPTADGAGPAVGFLPGLDMPAQDLPGAPVAPMPDPWAVGEPADAADVLGTPAALPGLGDEDLADFPSPETLPPGEGATEEGEDVLDFLTSGARTEPLTPSVEAVPAEAVPIPPFSVAAPASPDAVAGPDGDVLSFFADGGAAAEVSFPAIPEPPSGEDSTLALLIGAGAAGPVPALPPDPDRFGQSPQCPGAESLALPGTGPAAGQDTDAPAWPMAPDPWTAAPLLRPDEAPGAALPEASSAALPPADPWGTAVTWSADPAAEAAPTPSTGSSTVPPAPEGGGWWTSGGGRVPPMVWALSALPSPVDFAYLLEAEA